VLEEVITGVSPVVAGVGVAAAVVDLVDDVVVPMPAPAGGVRVMRWTNNTSGFVLRRMAALVTNGSRPDKVFEDKDVTMWPKSLRTGVRRL
jgi:hypothetical protein